MKYYWEIKRIKDEPVLVSPTVGKKAQEQWLKGIEKIMLPNQVAISSSVIASIEESTTVMPDDNVYLLGDGVSPDHGAKTNEDGSVVAHWYKKIVSQREYNKYGYGQIPGYHVLSRLGDAITIAFTRVEEHNEIIPNYLEKCTMDESNALTKASNG